MRMLSTREHSISTRCVMSVMTYIQNGRSRMHARDHRQLVVEHTEFLEGAGARVVVADDRLHRVVRLARQRDELIAGAQDAEEHSR